MSRATSPAGLSEEKLARAALTYLAEPGDPALGALLEICEPAEVLAAIRAGMLPGTGPGCGDTPASRAALERALGRWRVRLPSLPDDIADTCRSSIRLVCPGDAEWPASLDQLDQARPYALWLRGRADLRFACTRSVAMVGSRAATGYGGHVTGEIAADLGERGWAIVSGGAYGIDAAAHRGALAAEAITVAVLACGVDYPYPAGHADLFMAIAAQGLVISEWPPGRHPARMRFLVRNRVIAALACGTVIVEAGERSGALNTARHAAELGKPLMAVPGPVTSAQSAGCHRIMREWGATCVTRAADIIEMLSPLSVADALAPGDDLASPGPSFPHSEPSRDDLDADSARVLDALPARGGAGPSTIAVAAGVDLDTVLRCLGRLAGDGFIERGDGGWRLRRLGALRDLSRHLVVEVDLAAQVGLVADTAAARRALIFVAELELEFRIALPGQLLQAVALNVLGIGEADRPQPLGGQPLVDLVQMVADQLLLRIGDLPLVRLAGMLAGRVVEAFPARAGSR
jgi:DNA processing protein